MPEESSETQNSEQTSAPTAPQEPIPEAPIPPSTSESTPMPPEAPESPTEAESAIPVKDDNSANEPLDQLNEPEHIDIPTKPNITVERTPDTVTITEVMQPTAHSARNEPLVKSSISSVVGNTAKQERVKNKLEKIIEFLNTKTTITNDEVEKLLHVSDATATRYLEQLEKEGKVKQSGRTGQSVSYSRI